MPFDLDITENEFYKMAAATAATDKARQILSRLLERRFGPISRATQKRLKEADLVQLERWADQFVTAQKLNDVFAKQ